jgi:N-methylhydantoinase A
MVNVRLAVIGQRPRLQFPSVSKTGDAKPTRHRDVVFTDSRKPVNCPVYDRDTLGAGSRIVGPAIVQEHGTTTVLFAGDECTVVESGEMLVSVKGA